MDVVTAVAWVLGVVAWLAIGTWGTVRAWTAEFDLEPADVLAVVGMSPLGPLAWPFTMAISWLLRCDVLDEGRVLVHRRRPKSVHPS